MVIIQSLERAFAILRALAIRPARISDLATLVGLPKSTVARMLVTLELVGAVERDGDSQAYRIGEGLAQLAAPTDFTTALVVAIKPHLAHLSAAIGEAAGFSVPEGYAIHYLVQVDSPRPVQVRDYSGTSAPMHVSPAGLCVMAEWPEAELARYLVRPLERNTPASVTDPDRIRVRLERIRRDGYAWIHEEFAEGLSSVAAPVHDGHGRLVGTITVHGPTYRFPPPREAERIGNAVRSAAARFSAARLAG
ncbi:MAG: IclR family transcriptional regulator [Candidatus Limnocylindria bacterium]